MEVLLQYLVRGLVQYPDQVQVAMVPRRPGQSEHGAPNWELRVAAEDFPRVVGRGGRTARALRAVLEGSYRALGGSGLERPGLNIMDP
ncbi:MAG: KH domain-containing protein, partial [Terriglobales bacterium]